MSRCSCPETTTLRGTTYSVRLDPDCPSHGLAAGVAYPPMDRHALPGEDARAAQKRLYDEALGWYVCCRCGRRGRRAFIRQEGGARACANALACQKRVAATQRREFAALLAARREYAALLAARVPFRP